MNFIKSAIPMGLLVLPLLLMSGCDKKDEGDKLKPAALVNGALVAAEQVEMELKKIGAVPPDQSQDIANRILRNVVDQELLAQQAAQAKLDEQPEVQVKLAAARRQILAEAQINGLTKSMSAPAESEIRAYFDAHPELFSKRHVYKLQELIVHASPENIAEVSELAAKAKTAREFATAMQAKGIPVGAREVVKTAEDLPTELLAKLGQMKPGQSMSQSQGGKLNLVVLVAAEEQPVTYEQSSVMIARYLANTGKRNHIEDELKKLRSAAKIEFTPPYADIPDTESDQKKP